VQLVFKFKVKMFCYVCEVQTPTLASLITHYKVMHLLGPFSTYTCKENNCSQSFQTLSSFKKHVLKKHINILKNNEMVQTNNNSQNNLSLVDNDVIIQGINIVNSINNPSTIEVTDVPLIPNQNIFDVHKSIQEFHLLAVQFCLNLHNNNNFCRSDVLNVQNDIEDKIIKPIISLLENIIQNEIKDSLTLSKFSMVTLAISDPFKFCRTEHFLNNWLTNNGLLCDKLQQFSINNEINLVSHNGETFYDEQNAKGILMPLKFQFKTYFEQNNNLNLSLHRYDKLINHSVLDRNYTLSNFIQGSLWKEKILSHQNKLVIPFFMYIDDFEINNPLGSKSMCHSISAIYYSFPLSKQSSKLDHIFLAALIKSKDLKSFGNELCLKNLIDELNSLEKDGIIINTPDGPKQVYFILGLITGDNLGLNSICDFSKSFSANYFCRFCKANKTLTHSLTEEDSSLLRNTNNYTTDIEINDFSQTGINKLSILNQINLFHVTTNFCVDIMHDVFEGICHYNMCHLILYYTEKVKIISLDTLNFRKQNFSYGLEQKNNSPPIEKHHLSKFHLKMSARQMMCFVHFFPLIVGDLIPEDDEVWVFLLNFLDIIDILLSNELTQYSAPQLKYLIHKHNSDYVTLFQDNLKPKHHFLTHYPSIILKSGPPRHFWCFRYEAKHKELKMYARAITSRKNICLTLAKKYQYKFAHLLLNKESNKTFVVNMRHMINSNHTEFLLNNSFMSSTSFDSYSKINFKGTEYEVGNYITNFIDEVCLYEILEIIVIQNNVSFIVHQIQLNSFNIHLKAYEVDKDKSIISKSLINIEQFSSSPINIHVVPDGRLFIRLKEYF